MVDMNKTLIVMVLDRSGSMSTIRGATIEGVNTFLEEQKKLPGDCLFSLIQFDDRYEIVWKNMPISRVPSLNENTFVPRGSTALLDAIGKTIDDTGAELAALPEEQRPGKIFFVIQTDGLENASDRYSPKQINEMIGHQRDVYKWEFIFMGANQDAISTAAQMGIGGASSLTYAASSSGVRGTYRGLSSAISHSRSSSGSAAGTVSFSDSDRSNATN